MLTKDDLQFIIECLKIRENTTMCISTSNDCLGLIEKIEKLEERDE